MDIPYFNRKAAIIPIIQNTPLPLSRSRPDDLSIQERKELPNQETDVQPHQRSIVLLHWSLFLFTTHAQLFLLFLFLLFLLFLVRATLPLQLLVRLRTILSGPLYPIALNVIRPLVWPD